MAEERPLARAGRSAPGLASCQRPLCLTDAASRTGPCGKGGASRGPRRLLPDRKGEAPVAPRPVRSPGGASRRARGLPQPAGRDRDVSALDGARGAPAPAGPARPDRRGSIGQKRPPARYGISHLCAPLVSDPADDRLDRPTHDWKADHGAPTSFFPHDLRVAAGVRPGDRLCGDPVAAAGQPARREVSAAAGRARPGVRAGRGRSRLRHPRDRG